MLIIREGHEAVINEEEVEEYRLKVESFISQALTKQREETEKAYGGCKECYGKGYSTQQVGEESGWTDFGKMEKIITQPPRIKMNFCTCGRGKALSDLLTIIK